MPEGFIAPGALVALVRNTAPWLFELPVDEAAGPREFLAVLRRGADADPKDATDDARLVSYLTLCLAAHHASVASYVPTDVDSKIRGLLWRRAPDEATLAAMLDVTLRFLDWDVPLVSRRYVVVAGFGVHSGHDGERLSVLAGALGRAIQLGCTDLAAAAQARIEAELAREAAAFQRLQATPGAELNLLRLAAILTHNAGDLDQGLGFWPKSEAHRARARRFARLAHEELADPEGAFAPVFGKAAALYKMSLAPEGHRNYPLRGVKSLRQSCDFLLPMAPFLDEWGELLGRDQRLRDADVAEVLEALVVGSRKLGHQRGYYRAIAGLVAGLGPRLEDVVAKMPAAARADFRASELRKLIAVQRASFESMMRKMGRSG